MPRKAATKETVEEAVEENTVESTVEDTLTPPQPENVTVMVQRIIDTVKGYNAKFNNERTLSVVDLGTQPAHQGTRYRQLYVEALQGLMVISLREGFKSVHGGNEQRRVLARVVVPVTETEAYHALLRRFFAYSEAKTLEDSNFLLNELTVTVKT